MKDDAKILFNLKCYLESLLASGQDKIFYNDLLNDEKTIDCINAIEDLLKERKKYTILLTDKEYRKVIENAQKDIAEQKDKRIQELEEENAILKKASNIAKDVNIEDVTEVMNKSFEEFMSDYISKQVVIDKVEELNKEIKNGDEIEAIFKIKQQQILQELLEGRNENG